MSSIEKPLGKNKILKTEKTTEPRKEMIFCKF